MAKIVWCDRSFSAISSERHFEWIGIGKCKAGGAIALMRAYVPEICQCNEASLLAFLLNLRTSARWPATPLGRVASTNFKRVSGVILLWFCGHGEISLRSVRLARA